MSSRSMERRAAALLTSLGLAGAVLGGAIAPAASVSAASSGSFTCGSADMNDPAILGPGTYDSVVVDGFCFVPHGSTIVIRKGLDVAADGFLMAAAFEDGICDRSITIGGGVTVGTDATLFLGDGAGSDCVPNTHTVVNGGIRANGAFSVVIHGTVVNGGILMQGGGAPICNEETFFPCSFNAVEDSQVTGGISIVGYAGFWFGMARNQVSGGVSLQRNTLADLDSMEILSNTFKGGLFCAGNAPVPTNVADGVTLEPNTVIGPETGQCAGL